MKLSSAQQNLIRQLANVFRIFVQWGSVPFIVYLGFRHGADPQPSGEIIPLSLTGLFYG
uniref:Mitochondrial import receptor subunit TOM7 homolog n=1 Tax=Elaeophora elaphi TaxID=1147741 RepID=A0A0R3RVR2_9BILA